MIPLVHIGMASHNAAASIESTFLDWQAQTYRRWRMTISDNASTDETRQIFARSFRDLRVQIKPTDRNIGAYRNFERLRSFAGDAKYFCWSSDHDRRAPDFLEQAVELMEQDPKVILVTSQLGRQSADGTPVDIIDENLDTRHCTGPIERVRHVLQTVSWNYAVYGVWRNEALDNPVQLHDIYAADYLLPILHAAKGTFAHIEQPLLRAVINHGAERNDWDSIPRIAAMSFLPEKPPLDHIVDAAIAIAVAARRIAPDGALDQDACAFAHRRWHVNLSKESQNS